MKKEKSCGAVVFKIEYYELFFLVEHMIQGHTSLPKGHMEDKETETKTAIREIREETGLQVKLDTEFRQVIRYSPAEGVRKQVVYFVAEAASGKLKRQESEIAGLEWLPFREAIGAMTYDDDKNILKQAAEYLKNKYPDRIDLSESTAVPGYHKMIDTNMSITLKQLLADRAVEFAAVKHAGQFRKGTTIPYITHPVEALEIVSGITEDAEIRAAAVLHDTLEDTATSREELDYCFGKRVAELVAAESENKREDQPPESTWKRRKEETIRHLKEAGTDVRMIALGDKLSNMRMIRRDYADLGEKLWERFNQKDPVIYGWYYRSIAEILAEDKTLKDTRAFREYAALVAEVFGEKEE